MKVGFVFTNYNNSMLSIQAVRSIEKSKHDFDVTVLIVDNDSVQDEKALLLSEKLPDFVHIIWSKVNIGYFPGLKLGLDTLCADLTSYDFVVVGNNDLIFDAAFFDSLYSNGDDLERFPVICPAIVTIDGVHQNPHVQYGVSRFREIVWDIYYSNFLISKFIVILLNFFGGYFRRNDHRCCYENGFIDQGYGACYILTNKFFSKYKTLWSPSFLMGEEFQLSRQLKCRGDKMYYFSNTVVFHHDHATISKIPSRLLWGYARGAHKIYRFFVNPYRLKMDNGKAIEDFDRMKG